MSGKILKLSIESFKGINNMDLEWDNEYAIMAIIADGGLGKSSVISFVDSCLRGIVPDEAINLATKKAKGSLQFELEGKKYTIDISKTKKSELVKIKSDDNMSGGKEVLRKIVGNVTVPVIELIHMQPEDQITEFKTLFKIDTSELAAKRKTIYDSRTLINGQIKSIKSYLYQNNIDDTFKEKLSQYQDAKELGSLPDQLNDLKNYREAVRLKKEKQSFNHNKIANLRSDAQLLQRQIELLQQQLKEKKDQESIFSKENDQMASELLKLEKIIQDSKSVEEIQAEIKSINDFNTERNNVIVTVKKIQEMESLTGQAADKTLEIEKLDSEIENYIKTSLPDLGEVKLYEPKIDAEGKVIEERNGIYWNDKPIGILSTTEAINFGMDLKKAINPNGLPIILLDDFESVGSLGRAAVQDMADKGWQALVAEVDSKQSNLKVVLKNNIDDDTKEKILKA